MRTWVVITLVGLLVVSFAGPAAADDLGELFATAACGDSSKGKHCEAMQRMYKHQRNAWVKPLRKVVGKVRPADVPNVVVYPFGGGDLSGALTVYPDATDITTLSLEPAGDVHAIAVMDKKALQEDLDAVKIGIRRLYNAGHSTTEVLQDTARAQLPGTLVYALAGMSLHDMEPVQLRYFNIEPDGSLKYLTTGTSGSVEIQFKPKGSSDKSAIRTYRHIHANLDDEHMKADGRVLKHLGTKGTVAVITKAASFLLWRDDFSAIRDYLLANTAWMISDATGIPPKHAAAAGYEQITYGDFVAPYFTRDPKNVRRDMIKMWKGQPHRDLPVRFGYPDKEKHNHMMVMRKAAK